MNKIKINTAEKSLYYDGKIIAEYVIEYPEIINSKILIEDNVKNLSKNNLEYNARISEINKFNHYNRELALKIKNFAEGKFFEIAKEIYKLNKKRRL